MRFFILSLILIQSLFVANAFAEDAGTDVVRYESKQYSISHDTYPKYQAVYLGENAQKDRDGGYSYRGITGLKANDGFQEVGKALVKGLDILLVINNSGGGLSKVFHDFGEKIRSTCRENGKQTCEITTYVTERCASACIDLFMYGDHRYAAKKTYFGFHRAYIELFSKTMEVTSREKMAQLYINNGADKDWFMSHLDIFDTKGGDVTDLYSQDLLDSGIVQQISEVETEDFRMAHGDTFDEQMMEYIAMKRKSN